MHFTNFGGDGRTEIVIQVWDDDAISKDDPIGSIMLTAADFADDGSLTTITKALEGTEGGPSLDGTTVTLELQLGPAPVFPFNLILQPNIGELDAISPEIGSEHNTFEDQHLKTFCDMIPADFKLFDVYAVLDPDVVNVRF